MTLNARLHNKLLFKNERKRIYQGLLVIKAVYELTLACIESDAFLLPENAIDFTYNTLHKYGQDTNPDIISQMCNAIHAVDQKGKNTMSFKTFICKSLGISENEIDLKIDMNGKISIFMSKSSESLFDKDYCNIILYALNRMNNHFIRKKSNILIDKSNILKQIPEHLCNYPLYKIQKEEFII